MIEDAEHQDDVETPMARLRHAAHVAGLDRGAPVQSQRRCTQAGALHMPLARLDPDRAGAGERRLEAIASFLAGEVEQARSRQRLARQRLGQRDHAPQGQRVGVGRHGQPIRPALGVEDFACPWIAGP